MADFVAFASADDARLVLDTARRIKASGLLDRVGGSNEDRPLEQPIYVLNESGETIPPFGVMQATGLVGDDVREAFSVAKVTDPTGSSGPILFNGETEIQDGQIGVAQSGNVIRHSPQSLPAAGTFASYAPRIDSYELATQQGGQFVLAQRDGIDAGQAHLCRVFYYPAVSFMYKNRSGGTADIYWLDETDTGHSAEIIDALDVIDPAVPNGYCVLQGLNFFAKQAPCE